MHLTLATAKKPRCFFLYAMAPNGLLPAAANKAINDLIGLPELPLCLYHDHFIGAPGGLAIFDVQDLAEIEAITAAAGELLKGWKVDLRPLVFSFNPAAFDEQIAYTQSAYGNTDWNQLRLQHRPTYCDPRIETETASD